MFKFLVSALIVLSASVCVHADDCVNRLEESLMAQKKFAGVNDAYVCSEGDSCAVLYQVDNRPYPNIINLAYMDQERDVDLPWNVKDSKNTWRGLEESGNFLCAPVKTYAWATEKNSETLSIRVHKGTAYDAVFCPISFTDFDYTVTCSKL